MTLAIVLSSIAFVPSLIFLGLPWWAIVLIILAAHIISLITFPFIGPVDVYVAAGFSVAAYFSSSGTIHTWSFIVALYAVILFVYYLHTIISLKEYLHDEKKLRGEIEEDSFLYKRFISLYYSLISTIPLVISLLILHIPLIYSVIAIIVAVVCTKFKTFPINIIICVFSIFAYIVAGLLGNWLNWAILSILMSLWFSISYINMLISNKTNASW